MMKTPIKRQTLSSWIEKQDSMLFTEKQMLNIKTQIKCKKRVKDIQASLENQDVYITIKQSRLSDKEYSRNRKEAFIVINGPPTHQKDAIVLMYMYLLAELQNP